MLMVSCMMKYMPAESVIAWARVVINHQSPLNISQNFRMLYCASRALVNLCSSICVSCSSRENMRITLRLVKVSTILLKRLSQYMFAACWFLYAVFPSFWIQNMAKGKRIMEIRVIWISIMQPDVIKITVTRIWGTMWSIPLSHRSQTASLARSMIFCFSPCCIPIW